MFSFMASHYYQTKIAAPHSGTASTYPRGFSLYELNLRRKNYYSMSGSIWAKVWAPWDYRNSVCTQQPLFLVGLAASTSTMVIKKRMPAVAKNKYHNNFMMPFMRMPAVCIFVFVSIRTPRRRGRRQSPAPSSRCIRYRTKSQIRIFSWETPPWLSLS